MSAAITVRQPYRASYGLVKRPASGDRNKDEKEELPPISLVTAESSPTSRIGALLRELGRMQRLQHYLGETAQAGDISRSTASLAWKAWKQLSVAMAENLPVPDASPGPEGQLLYTWNKNEHHFELEVFPDSRGEFFYLNRQTDDAWEQEYKIGDPIPTDAISMLGLFLLYDA